MNAIVTWLTKGSWKTTSTGLLAIAGAIVRLAFAIKAGAITEESIMTSVTAIITGVGLLAARDNDKSSEQVGADAQTKAVNDFAANKLILLPFLVAAVAVGGGCRTLAPDGEYHGDKVLFEADTAITTSYALVDTFLKWEADNRDALKVWPEIKTYADKLRTDYPYWHRTAIALRDAYAASPSDAQAANLQKSLSLLRTSLVEASGYMARAAQTK